MKDRTKEETDNQLINKQSKINIMELGLKIEIRTVSANPLTCINDTVVKLFDDWDKPVVFHLNSGELKGDIAYKQCDDLIDNIEHIKTITHLS